MAKRNQVTAKLKIATEAQLENSKQFSRQLNNILDNFDFGEKINRQFKDAQEQLKLYNKVLEKNKDKRLISNEDLKNLEKASEGIANIISKTENLYNNLNSQGIQKFSKEYIAKVRAQEAEIARIKQEFQNKTGKVYDEEIKNVDKLNEKIQNLSHLKQELGKFNLEFFKEEEITRLTNQFNKAQENLKSIQSTILVAQDAYESIIKKSIDETGYIRSDYNRKTNPGTLEEFTQKQEVKAQESLNNSIEKTKQKLEEIKEEKEKILSKDEESLKAIEKYNKQIQKLEQELTNNKLKLEKSLNGEELLVNIKKVTNEYNKQYQIYKTMLDASKARDEVAFQAGYGTYSNLSRKEKKAITETSSIQSQLDDDNNITNIAQTKMQEINGTIEQTNAELENSNNFLKIISEATKKLATQSERMADEQDVVQSSKNINAHTDADGRETRKTTNEQTKILSRDILRSRAEGAKKGIINIADMPLNLENFSDLLDTTKDTEVDDYKLAAEAINNFTIEIETTVNYLKSLQNKYDSIEDFTPEEVLEIGKSNQDALINIIKNINNIFDIAENNLAQRRNIPGISKEEQSILGRDLDYLEIRKAEILTPLNQELERVKENTKIIIDSINDIKEPINNSEQSFQQLGNISSETTDSIKEAAEESEFLGSVWDELSNKVGYFLSANYIFDLMIRKIQEATQTVAQMDKDMTQIGLVLGKTSKQVWKNFDTYSQMATRLNTTTSEVTTAMKLFYQQGLNTTEVNKMVEASAIAAALGESTLAEASETLTSIINSYNLTANDAIEVTDKISQVAIVSAADFNEISIAIEKVASSAASAGLDLDHMMGYLAKMIETTREAPTNIGTALKTIIANFAQFREDPTSLTEEGFSMNDVDKALKTVGINLTDTSGEMRDLGIVMDELGKRWDKLSRNQKSYLATMIAGTRQQSRFYALMNDYGRTIELVTASTNSAGKSQQQFALYSNSLEAATNRLNNQWQIFFNNLTQGNGVLANFTNILTNLMKVVNTIGPLQTAFGLVSFIKSAREAVTTFKNLSTLIETRKIKTSEKKTAFEQVKEDVNLTPEQKQTEYKKIQSDYMKDRLKDVEKLTAAEAKYLNTIEKVDGQQQKLDTQFKKSNGTFKETIGTTEKLSYSMQSLKNSGSKALASVKLGINQVGKAIIGFSKQFLILAALELAFKAFSLAVTTVKNSLGANTEVYIENAEKASENADNINSLTEEYAELSKKINKTQEEQKRLKEIVEEVTKIDAALGQQLRDNVNNYEANIKAMKSYADLQEKIAAQETARAIKSDTSALNNWWRGYIDIYDNEDVTRKERFDNWRNLAAARGQQYGLDETNISLLNRYIENLIYNNEDLSTKGILASTATVDEYVINFIDKLKNLSTEQQQSYTNFLTNMNNGSSTYAELTQQLDELDLPYQIIQSLQRQINTIQTGIENAIDTNLFIEDKELALTNVETIAIDKAENLVNPDTSTMSTKEKEIYKKDWARFIQDTELVKKYNQAQLEGGDSLKKFTHELIVAEGYSSIFADNIYKMTSALGDVEAFEKSVAAIKSIGDLNLEKILTGTVSQLDILKEIVSKNLTFEDINYEQGILTISNQTLINKQFEAIEKTFEIIEEALDERRENISNLINQTNTILSEIQTQQDLLYDARDAINLNSQSNFLQGLGTYQDGYTKGNPNDKYLMSYWDIGTSVSKMREEKSLADLQKAREYHINNLEKGNEATKAHTRDSIQVISSIISERTQNVKRYQRGSSQEDAARYFVEQYQTLQDINNRLKETDKLSQEYFNLTYQSTELSKELQLVLKERPSILSTINGWAQETDKAYNDQLTTHQAIYDELNKQIEKQEEIIQKLKEQAQMSAKWQGAYSAVSTSIQTGLTVDNQLDALKQFYTEGKKEILDYLAVQKLLTQDFSLYQYLESTETGWKINTAAIEENAKATIDLAISNNNVLIEKAKTALKALEKETEGVDAWETSTIDSVGEVINGYSNLSTTHESEVETVAQNLGIEETSWIHWTDTVIKSIRAAAEQYNLFRKNILLPVDFSLFKTGFSAEVLTDVDTVSDSTIEKLNKKKDEIKNALTVVGGNDKSDIEKAKEILRNQIALLEGSNRELEKQKEGIGKYLTGNLYDTEGDSFEQVIDKLEHFYNYLRKIEEIEAKLSKLETKQSYAALSNSYNTDLIKQENDLLTEKIKLYSKYIAEEEDYLKKRREEITSQYSDWAYFTESGLLQLKQVNFISNTEEEKARYDAFKELIDLYTSEYNTALENSNSMLDAHSQKLQNIQEMWDKQNQSIQDVLDNLEYLKKVVTDKKNLQFSPTEGFMYNEKIFKATLKQYEQLKKNREDLLNESDASYENIMSSNVRDLLQYNEAKGYFELTAYAETLLDIVGLEGDRARLAQELVAKDQKMAEARQQNYEDISSINSEIKDLVENQLSEGESILQSWTDQIDKMFDMIDKNISKLETKQNLFGTTTDTIQEQFDAISKAAAIANNEYQNLQKIGDSLAKQIKDSYGDYIDEIDGQLFINEAAINNDTTLTELQRIEAKTLVSKYNIIQEQTDEAEDLYYGYLEKLQEMEEEKQDATISLIQEIHDELMEIDQEEVDALRDKYSEMSNLDNEYYSALQQKISDARQNRQIEQEGYNITELQNRLAITTKDTSTAYSADARSLRKELQDALQNRADSEIDREMERIQREQQERQKDRDLQIQQMENLITFKDENGIYWKESQALFEQGRVKTEAFLASRYEKEDISQAELQNKLDSANEELDRAYALLDGTIYSALQQEIENISITNRIITDLSENTEEGYANLTTQLNQVVEALTSKDSVILQELSKWFSQNYDDESDSIGVTTGDTRNQTIEGLKSQMEANSQAWWKANEAGDTQKMKDLADRNNEIARVLEEKYGIILRRRADGSWYYVGTGDKYYTASRYADGGYVNYTGIAQVDGTPAKPEAFLNAKQTALFENLRNALSSYNSKSSVKTSDNSSSSVSIDNLTISVKEVADVDSIDKITKEVKRSIYNDSTKGSTIKVTRR